MRDYTNLDRFLDERVWDAHPNYDYENHTNTQVARDAIDTLCREFLKPNALVIDVGCGDGRDIKYFREKGFNAVGLNFLESEFKAIRDKELPCIWGDQSFIPADNESFHCLYSRHCLEHSVMPFFTLVEYNRVLKMGGTCYIELPSPDVSGGQHETNPNHYAVMGRKMWEELFIRSGFEIRKFYTVDFSLPEAEDPNQLIDQWFCYYLQKVTVSHGGFFRSKENLEKYSKKIGQEVKND